MNNMKRLTISLFSIIFFYYPIICENISLEYADDYSWEASCYTHKNGREDFYYLFEFSPRNHEVLLIVEDIELKELNREYYNYKSFFYGDLYHLRIYKSNADQPEYVIEHGEDNNIIINTPGSNEVIFESFETIKDYYIRSNLQGILNDNRVRLRNAPNLESNKIGSLMKGDIVQILNRSDKRMIINNMNSFWFKVKTKSAVAGWAYGYFLELGNEIYSSDLENIVVFMKSIELDQGTSTNLLFYKNNEKISETGWLGSNEVLVFANEKKILLGKSTINRDIMNNPDNIFDEPSILIYDIYGNIVTEFSLPKMTILLKKIENAPLFYLIESYGIDSDQEWSNRLFIYDLEGDVVVEETYNDSLSTYQFDYNHKRYNLLLK